ncbi:flavin reductase family protein [Flammeovirga kamogawensis]|uniref:Flavin reductase family protein n=1 Tax=Flammeovirga kamogawensis TaxID=373891 RepID=A0ABX8GX69_9BACT|nr:flavin reductase family protein [Flammeovirga kamogawensis]MBB6460840.1 flavin reductase (DIM6/NTAB) family NADH-FMN oxidoreductase RutF [Flammeovirga kamogawensis]QWG08190.1 flavin reductase family protein [Flammeovirga kamogawensis]TRX69993.1 flavin reductase [Flammeovirga kamogawensis]
MQTKTMDTTLFKAAMRHLTATVTVVSTNGVAGKNGITATAVSSLSDTPPSLVVCVNKKSDFHDQVTKNKVFSVHILSEEMTEISNCFAGYKGLQGEDKFSMGEWTLENNFYNLNKALVNIHCELAESHNGFSHSIFVGKMIDIELNEENEDKPLLYGQGNYTTIK